MSFLWPREDHIGHSKRKHTTVESTQSNIKGSLIFGVRGGGYFFQLSTFFGKTFGSRCLSSFLLRHSRNFGRPVRLRTFGISFCMEWLEHSGRSRNCDFRAESSFMTICNVPAAFSSPCSSAPNRYADTHENVTPQLGKSFSDQDDSDQV